MTIIINPTPSPEARTLVRRRQGLLDDIARAADAQDARRTLILAGELGLLETAIARRIRCLTICEADARLLREALV